jgi:NitT/TauT family transport system substrate-binding protein
MHLKNVRKYAQRATLAVASVAMAGTALVSASATAGATTPTTSVKLILGWVVAPEFAGFVAAKDLGYYKAEGLNVTVVPGGPNVNTEQLVGAGSGQFGVETYDGVLASNDAGTDLVSLAQLFTRPGLRMISLKSAHLNNPASWKGKTIGVSSSDNSLYATLNKYHINSTTGINAVQQGYNMDQFLSHQLDLVSGYTFNEVGQVVTGGIPYSKLNLYNFASDGTATLEDQIFGNGAYVKSNPGIAAKLVAASLKGWIYCRNNPQSCVNMATKAGSTFPKKFAIWSMNQVNQLIWPASRGVGYMNMAAFENSANVLYDNKVIKNKPNLAATVDTSVYDAAVKIIGKANLVGANYKPISGLNP